MSHEPIASVSCDAAENARLHEALRKLLAYAMSCKKRNTPEWMEGFATRLNAALAALGDDSRVIWPGKWASEFQFEIGEENLKEQS